MVGRPSDFELDESDEAKASASFMHKLGGWDGKPFRPIGMIGGAYPLIEVDEIPEDVT